jgi:glycosyltransferase involved in cell wall biosynthesis
LDKKKVLITIEWFDPAYKAGGPVISIIKLIENMAEYYDFYVLTGSVDYGDNEQLPGIETDKWVDWRGLAKVYYVSEKNKTRRNIFDIMDEAGADIYYIQGIFSPYFSIFPLIWWHQAKEDRAIVASRGMFHDSALSIKKWKKQAYLYGAKIMGWFHHITFHSTNPEETRYLKKIVGREANYSEASNFPRVLKFYPEKHVKKEKQLSLLSVARISPEKDSLFLVEALTAVRVPVTLTIVGNYNDEYYFEQFKRKMEAVPEHITINYVGHKNLNELQAFYDTSQVFILPTRGENYGHAIIEALSSGMPCIISQRTPWNGLGKMNAGFNLESDVDHYRNVIENYYNMSEEEFAKCAKSAREYAESAIRIDEIKEAYLKLLA